MKKHFLPFLFLLTFTAVQGQEIPVVKFNTIEDLMAQEGDHILVMNFWATWCKPCIIELPYFERLHERYPGDVKVILVSMDFPDEYESRLIPFVQRKNLQPQVMLLDEVDANAWIDRVDPSWSGAIPATLIINKKTGERVFHEGELEEDKLNSLIKNIQKL